MSTYVCINMDHSNSKEGFMKLSNVFLEVVLSLIVDPLLEVMEIEDVRVTDLPVIEPLHEEWEVVTDFFSVENSVDHVAAKQPELNFISCMRMYLFVLMYRLEDMGCSRSVSEL